MLIYVILHVFFVFHLDSTEADNTGVLLKP